LDGQDYEFFTVEFVFDNQRSFTVQIVLKRSDQSAVSDGEVVVPVSKEIVVCAGISISNLPFHKASCTITGDNGMNVRPRRPSHAGRCNHDCLLITVTFEIEKVESPKIWRGINRTVMLLVEPCTDFVLTNLYFPLCDRK
jgi:cytochrome c oxidase assembly protein Cox11